jgi:hypothetical protein
MRQRIDDARVEHLGLLIRRSSTAILAMTYGVRGADAQEIGPERPPVQYA